MIKTGQQKILMALIVFFNEATCQAENVTFKKDTLSNMNWIPYILILGILCIVLFLLAKKSKDLGKTDTGCKIIEQIPLDHKTKVFILDYQGQRFLLANNQNALAIHPLQEEQSSL